MYNIKRHCEESGLKVRSSFQGGCEVEIPGGDGKTLVVSQFFQVISLLEKKAEVERSYNRTKKLLSAQAAAKTKSWSSHVPAV